MSTSQAFERFKEIDSLPNFEEKHRAWLKDYEGLYFSIGEDKFDKILWQQQKEKYIYSDKRFNEPIECIDGKFRANPNKMTRHPRRLVIEFDDEEPEKIKKNLEEVRDKLKKNCWGYIESTHIGKSNYLWVEFNRDITDKEAERFLRWICPSGALIDLNFASSNRRLPVLFAEHWKYPNKKEIPVDFYEGNTIDISLLKGGKIKGNEEYKTYRKPNLQKAVQIFSGKIELAKRFSEEQPIYYDNSGIWWLWNKEGYCWEMIDEVTITNHLLALGVNTINTTERNEIIQALKQIGRLYAPKPLPPTWIQFKDKLIDIKTGKEYKATPEYFAINPIPYKFHPEKFMNTPTIDKLFKEWVGEESTKTLYQILSYCLLPDYPIHRIFCFLGAGMNGKSCYFRLIEKFIGKNNICSTELDSLLNNRFEVTRLHKKLVCQMGETNFNELAKTSMLKKLTGQDLIGYEYKNKNLFEEHNYAKIMISTNNLPETTDKTVGFYRRWCIIDFPNQFLQEVDILKTIPEEEFECLAVKAGMILHELLEDMKFHNEGGIEERMKKYEDKSNPLAKFIQENCEEESNGDIPGWEFLKRYNSWAKENKFREMSDHSIGVGMKKKGYEQQRLSKDWFENGFGTKKVFRCWTGIRWKN